MTLLPADKHVDLPQGRIDYRDVGVGPTVLFVHGALVNGNLWRKVVAPLAATCRCVVPDWPLGGHAHPMRPDADLSPDGLAQLVADFMAALELHDVTLVGNDTGGAICQLVVTAHPQRIGRLVLTPTDAYEKCPPFPFWYLGLAARVPGGVWCLAQTTRFKPLLRTPATFGWLARTRIPDEVLDSYAGPLRQSADVRRDTRRVLAGLNKDVTMAVARRLPTFDRPVLLVWPPDNPFFQYAMAERLSRDFPQATLVPLPGARTFVPEDQPERLAELIATFVRDPAAVAG